MAYECLFPDVGEGIAEGRLIKWLVKQGDAIKEDQRIAEVETDKAVVEIPAPRKGTVKQLLYKEGEIIPVGKPMMLLDDGVPSILPQQAGTAASQAARAIPSPIQQQRATIQQQRVTITATARDILAMPDVRKRACEAGIDLAMIRGSGKDSRVLMTDLERKPGMGPEIQPTTSTAISPKNEEKAKAAIQPSPQVDFPPAIATPSTRKRARELRLDINKIPGTGKDGLITLDDVENAAMTPNASQVIAGITTDHLHTKPLQAQEANITRVPMSMLRLAIANKMIESHANTVPVTHIVEADVTDLVALREREKEELSKKGVKLTYLPFFMKAAIIALKAHPPFNAEIDMHDREIVLKNYYNIGIAIDTPQGLIIAVVPDADRKSIVEIAKEIAEHADLGRQGKLAIDRMKGSTFTITSIGSIGGDAFTPIINYPEAAILGIGTIKEKPVIKEGRIAIRRMATLSLTYDHRIVDGADAARFMVTLTGHIENPGLLFMEMM